MTAHASANRVFRRLRNSYLSERTVQPEDRQFEHPCATIHAAVPLSDGDAAYAG